MQVTRAAAIGAGALAALMFVLAWWLWGGKDRARATAHRTNEALSAVPVLPLVPQEPTRVEAGGVREGEARRPDLTDVRSACVDSPWRLDVRERCLAALDRRYQDELAVYVYPHTIREPRPWVPLPTANRVTWGDALEDPVALRQAVGDALADPECRSVADALGGDEGTADPYRHDLHGRCAADAIARLSAFHYACLRPRFAGDDWNWDEELSANWEILDKADTDFDEYQRQRHAQEDAWFQLGWRVQRCRAVPDAAFAELGVGDRRENNPAWLEKLAARLGSEWANALGYSVTGPGSASCGDHADPNRDALAEWHLPLAHAALARCYEPDDVRHVAHLQAANWHDRKGRLDWTGWKDGFTETQLAEAESEARRIYERGWEATYTP